MSDDDPQLSGLDAFALALDAIRVAREHGYDLSASFAAVLDACSGKDRRTLEVTAAMLAAFIATDMRPRDALTMDTWTEIAVWVSTTAEAGG